MPDGDTFERGNPARRPGRSWSRPSSCSASSSTRGATDRPRRRRAAAGQWIGDFELASRLSYFLWSSMPDDELWRAGGRRVAPVTGDVLDKQVRRMLRDPKAQALVDNFAGQWLQLRNLRYRQSGSRHVPELRRGSARGDDPRDRAVLRGGHARRPVSILDFLDATSPTSTSGWRGTTGYRESRASSSAGSSSKDSERGGLLTQASILTVTSNPTRTSPVKRGKWVLEQLLGTPPPPPPPNVPVLHGGPEGPDRGHVAAADGAAPRQGELCGLPQPAGPARIRP